MELFRIFRLISRPVCNMRQSKTLMTLLLLFGNVHLTFRYCHRISKATSQRHSGALATAKNILLVRKRRTMSFYRTICEHSCTKTQPDVIIFNKSLHLVKWFEMSPRVTLLRYVSTFLHKKGYLRDHIQQSLEKKSCEKISKCICILDSEVSSVIDLDSFKGNQMFPCT